MIEKNETEKLLKEYWDAVIWETFKIPIGSFYFSNNEGYPKPPLYYKNYKRTDYNYEGVNRFFHYTSLESALNIMNEGYIRMNDISLLDDPQELIFAGKSILAASGKSEFKKMKSRTFCLSMCERENFDMWRLYGDNGRGVAIVFKFLPDFKEWKNSFISKIYYNDKERLKVFDVLLERHNGFLKSNNLLIKENFSEEPNKILAWISIFLAFHKTSLYKYENEVRFLKFDFNDFSYKKLGCKLTKDFEKACYYKLPLLTKENLEKIATEKFTEKLLLRTPDKNRELRIKEYTNELYDRMNYLKRNLYDVGFKNDKEFIKGALGNGEPIILIEKILLGYRYNDEQLKKLKKSLRENLAGKTGFNIEIERTPLADQFHPKN